MSLNVNARTSGNVRVIDLDGRITLGPATERLREVVRREAANNANIILNLAKVSYMDSAGLGTMVGAHTHVSNQKGTIKLLNVQQRLKDLLQITRLYTLFEAFDNEADAVKSFGTAAPA